MGSGCRQVVVRARSLACAHPRAPGLRTAPRWADSTGDPATHCVHTPYPLDTLSGSARQAARGVGLGPAVALRLLSLAVLSSRHLQGPSLGKTW